ncbi:MAG: hypothetical protein ACM32O_19155 [Clostridia bacterium]
MWDGWPLERVLLIFVGLAFALIFIQVTLFHSRQNFRHWAMWVPVIETPIFAVLAIMLAFTQPTWLLWVFTILMWVGVAGGLYGGFLHTVGVGQRVGGYSESQNFLVGPPIILPLLITAISALGLLALYWGRS